MRTYLVTGGAGFIGSNYIHYMFKKYDNEIRIINVDKLTYAGNLENLKDIEGRDNYTFVKADICDSEAIMKIFDENDIDRVVHFAAESHVDRSIRNPEVFVKTNVLGTLVMLNAAKSAWELPDGTFKPDKKFLHVSTDEVYGSLEEDGGFFYETTPYDPHSPYSASKASSDMLVKSYMDTYKFPANITNCSNNYGPYQFPEKLIPLIINNALQGKKLPVYGDGKNVRDWLYVMDHAKGIDMVQEKGRLFETYNIGGHNEKQNIQIIHIILDIPTSCLNLPESSEEESGTIDEGKDAGTLHEGSGKGVFADALDEVEPGVTVQDGVQIGTPVAASSDANLQDLGVFKITHYCPCSICCGPYANGITSTGVTATTNHTIAVDPSVIPYGSKVVINGQVYVAEDCGGAIKKNRIDIYVATHAEGEAKGTYNTEVYLIK